MRIYIIFLVLLNFTHSLSTKNVPIIIVGAGPSAIAAATKLVKSGLTNVKILEAENRIGGRIHSVLFGDAFVDLGAEYVHGQKGNIVYDLVKDFNILGFEKSPGELFYSYGDIDEELKTDLINFGKNYFNLTDNVTNSKLTAEEFFLQQYNLIVVEKYKNNKDKLKIVLDATDYFKNYLLDNESALNLNDVSVLSDYIVSEGHQNINWNGLGYKTILEVLLENYPDPERTLPIKENILLSKKVTKISWQNKSCQKVLVQCADGTDFKAHHVIFTPSVGVLKANHNLLFAPELPQQKIKAIENIGIGAVIKVILHFNNSWWKSTDEEFFLVWSSEDKAKLLTEFPNDPIMEGKSWLSDINFVVPAKRNPHVLIIWIEGKMVPQIENLSDKQIIDGCMYVINKFLGKKYTITSPDSMIHSFWYTNPHFHGTWSYETVGAKNNHSHVKFRDDLAKPLINSEGIPVVLFAGEATHANKFSTVHGAIETGFREADRIINLYK